MDWNYTKTLSYLMQAEEITANGYKVVPVNSKGVPCFKGTLDRDIEYSRPDFEAWLVKYPSANLALVCGHNDIVALDVDVDDEKVTRYIRRVMENYDGVKLFRARTKSHRFAFIFRRGEGFGKIATMTSDSFIHPEHGAQYIEYKGNSLLTVVGSHRKDPESLYRFKKYTLLNTPSSELVTLSYHDVRDIFNAFSQRVPPEWGVGASFREGGSWDRSGTKSRNKDRAKITTNVDEFFASAGVGTEQPATELADEEIEGIIELSSEAFDKITETQRYKPYTEEEITTMLATLDGSLRHNWLNVGMALHKHYEGSDKGLKIWDEWAREFEGYAGWEDQSYHWSSFDPTGPMSMKTIESMARRTRILDNVRKQEEVVKADLTEGEKEDFQTFDEKPKIDAEEMYAYALRNYVHIMTDKRVGDMGKTVAESISLLSDLKSFYQGTCLLSKEKDATGKVKIVSTPIINAWQNDPSRYTAFDTAYAPGEGRLIKPGYWRDKMETYYNTYCPPVVKITMEQNLLAYFFDHMDYLFGEWGGTWMINWMAQMVQHPGERYRVTPYSISVYQGTGRGWYSDLLRLIVGKENFSSLRGIEDIIRSGAKSGFIDDKVLTVINEIRIPGNIRFSIMSRLKTIISDDIQEVDVKYGNQSYNQRIYTRFFLQSNHMNGITLDESDSRIQPFINRNKERPIEYYDNLYALLENDPEHNLVNQVYSYLSRYAINYDLLKRSINTPERQLLVMSGKSKTALAFHEFKQIVNQSKIFTNQILTDFVSSYITHISLDDEMSVINVRELKVLMSNEEIDARRIVHNNIRTIAMSFGSLDGINPKQMVEGMINTKNELELYIENLVKKKEDYMEQNVDSELL